MANIDTCLPVRVADMDLHLRLARETLWCCLTARCSGRRLRAAAEREISSGRRES